MEIPIPFIGSIDIEDEVLMIGGALWLLISLIMWEVLAFWSTQSEAFANMGLFAKILLFVILLPVSILIVHVQHNR